MPITLNKIKQEGNVIYIKSNPQTGIIALTSFVDNSSEPTGSFTKEFRYSLNGIIYTDWIELNVQNIQNIVVTQKDTLVIELKYNRNPENNQYLSVSTATIETTDNPITNSYYFKNSLFSDLFNSEDLEVLNWVINVLDKLFKKGLLPNYLERYNDR